MHNLVEDTFVKFALIRLFLFKSVLLKIIPLFSLAGVPLAQYRFARALNSRGHSVELIIGHLPTNLSPEEIHGLKINILHKKSVLRMFYSN